MFKEISQNRTFIGRLEFGDDLLAQITGFCKTNDIKLGSISVIGALQNVKMGYYSQEEKKYTGCVEINKKLEIASCMGNISLKDNEIFCHLHIVVSDYLGNAFGGHLMNGSMVFAAEFIINEFTGATLERKPEIKTGLPLW